MATAGMDVQVILCVHILWPLRRMAAARVITIPGGEAAEGQVTNSPEEDFPISPTPYDDLGGNGPV